MGLEYEITGNSNALSYNSNMGFDDLLGFTEQVGFATSIVTKKEFKDRFYEQGMKYDCKHRKERHSDELHRI